MIHARIIIRECRLFAKNLFVSPQPSEADEPALGPLFQKFELTLESGQRTEAVGPFYYHEQKDSLQTWAVPPLWAKAVDTNLNLMEFDILYPVFSYDRYGDQYRFHFCQVISWAGGPSQGEPIRNRFTIYPLYFQQRSSLPEENYTAFFPFYGHLRRRLFRDEISFVMFPLYLKSLKGDVVTRNYGYPFFHLRSGPSFSVTPR